jgi:hypothetical protein
VKAIGGVDKALEVFLTGEEARKGYCERAMREDIHCQRKVR